MSCKIHPAIQEYIDIVEQQIHPCCKDQIALVKHIKDCFAMEEIYIDTERADKYLGLQKYFPYKLSLIHI